MTRLEKQDWEDLKKSAENNLKQLEISGIQFNNLLSIANGKILEFPDEVKEVEEEIENVAAESG